MSPNDHTAEALPRLPPRERDAHKGDFGRVLIIAGSRGMAGAAGLAGMASLRSGAGLVTVATPGSSSGIVASYSPCYMTVPLVEDEDGLADFANVVDFLAAKGKFDAWAIGPGLGQSAGVTELVAQLYREVPKPMVVDADGLNALAKSLARNQKLLDKPAGPRILTPHPGEFARLTGVSAPKSQDQRIAQAAELAARDASGGTIVVLKGAGTIVARAGQFAVNATGNPGMATGGTGDCLTGILASLLAQRLSPWDAARLGVHVHGLAGDLAAEELGEVSLISSDLVEQLPRAFISLAALGA